MASKHGSPKRRVKAYREKKCAVGGGLQVIAAGVSRHDVRMMNALPIEGEEATLICVKYWRAFEDIKLGDGTETSYVYLCTAMNITLCLAETGIGEEYVPEMIPALEAMARAAKRGARTGQYRLDGPGMDAVSNALAIHEAQCAVATREDLFAAETMIAARIAAGQVHQTPAKTHRRAPAGAGHEIS